MGKVFFHGILPSYFGPFPILSDPHLLSLGLLVSIRFLWWDQIFLSRYSSSLFSLSIFWPRVFLLLFLLIGIGGDSGQTSRSWISCLLSVIESEPEWCSGKLHAVTELCSCGKLTTFTDWYCSSPENNALWDDQVRGLFYLLFFLNLKNSPQWAQTCCVNCKQGGVKAARNE